MFHLTRALKRASPYDTKDAKKGVMEINGQQYNYCCARKHCDSRPQIANKTNAVAGTSCGEKKTHVERNQHERTKQCGENTTCGENTIMWREQSMWRETHMWREHSM